MDASQESLPTKTIGFIVNPVAGMGGAVGLKGTDGKLILEKAISLGAKPIAAQRAETFLAGLSEADDLRLIVGAGSMGEEEAKKCGLKFLVKGEFKKETFPYDTQAIAKEMVDAHVDLLVFCGGDGTAKDIFKAVGTKVPVLGVPTGVKMHSALFAVTPQAAARVALRFLWVGLPLHEAEVMDIDEEAFRKGHLFRGTLRLHAKPLRTHSDSGQQT